jgi:hypothetical protein
MTTESTPATSRCSRCGAEFRCGLADRGGCWCARLPPLPAGAIAGGQDCLCERCLRASLRAAGAPVAPPN